MIDEFIYDGETIKIGSDEWKDAVLSSDPFEGDFGGDDNISDKIVKARTTKQLCSSCFSICESGTFNRVIADKVDGMLVTNRFCQNCCTAMGYYDIAIGTKEYKEGFRHPIVKMIDGLIQYDEDELDEAGLEPYTLQEHLYEIADTNRNILEKTLGTRWFDKPSADKHSVIFHMGDSK